MSMLSWERTTVVFFSWKLAANALAKLKVQLNLNFKQGEVFAQVALQRQITI